MDLLFNKICKFNQWLFWKNSLNGQYNNNIVYDWFFFLLSIMTSLTKITSHTFWGNSPSLV